MLRLSWETVTLTTTFPFTIARWGYAAHENVIVTITDDDGMTGMGEAAPNRYYQESVETVIAALQAFVSVLESAPPHALEMIERALSRVSPGNASARAAVSAALHDLYGKRLGIPVYQLWGLDAATTVTSSYTIGIADNDGIRQRVAAAEPYPILKVKLGTDRDQEILDVVRNAAPGKAIRVDANGAWDVEHAIRMSHVLHDMGVTMLEQPVAAKDLDGLRRVHEASPIPVFADEACLVAHDVPPLAGRCSGVNLKLAKCGGLREAHRIIHVARAHDLQVMAGCMIETSLGISAIAQLAPLLDEADFDGAALLADDPFEGVTIPEGRVTLRATPGVGAHRRTSVSLPA
jgi:L-alanine-DL-glutamate epimerase-like enolase superfamily enzyme